MTTEEQFPDVDPPRTPDQLAKIKTQMIGESIRMGHGRPNFTCDDCGYRYRCPLAYDLYNTDGDCLMEK